MTSTWKILDTTFDPYDEKKTYAEVKPVIDKNSKKLIVDGQVQCAALSFDGFEILKEIPTNLMEFAPRMDTLWINECGLTKITREDLKGLENLKNIYMIYMAIEELPGDLFADFMDLRVIAFGHNKIKVIGKDIFKHLERLDYVCLKSNSAVDVIYSRKEFDCDEEITRFWTLAELNAFLDNLASRTNRWLKIQKVLETDELKDFTIKIAESEIKVHKLMLFAHSPTLAEMIRSNPGADTIMLEDVEIEVFEIILDHIYDRDEPTDYKEGTTEKLFAAAGKLKIDELKDKVGDVLCEEANPENSFRLITLALKYGHDKLKKEAFEEFKKFVGDEGLPDEFMNNIDIVRELYHLKKAYKETVNREKQKISNQG